MDLQLHSMLSGRFSTGLNTADQYRPANMSNCVTISVFHKHQHITMLCSTTQP